MGSPLGVALGSHPPEICTTVQYTGFTPPAIRRPLGRPGPRCALSVPFWGQWAWPFRLESALVRVHGSMRRFACGLSGSIEASGGPTRRIRHMLSYRPSMGELEVRKKIVGCVHRVRTQQNFSGFLTRLFATSRKENSGFPVFALLLPPSTGIVRYRQKFWGLTLKGRISTSLTPLTLSVGG